MGVYIKSMEMPTDNTVLLRIYPENDGVCYVEQLDIDDDILDKYWAVPVPPHGRLIDADNLRRLYDPTDYELDVMSEDYFYRCHVAIPVIQQNIDDMPTIIPADETV